MTCRVRLEGVLVTAVDPGDEHHGVVSMIVGGRVGIEPYLAKEMSSRDDLYRYVEKTRPDYLVLEEYRFYPWMARQQGFSDFPTPQTIGALKYIASRMPTKVVMQKAMIKKEARTIALAQGVPMSVRALGSGKGAYKGPDFDAAWIKDEFDCKSSQHVRDAMAHGYFWAYTSPDSPVNLKEQS